MSNVVQLRESRVTAETYDYVGEAYGKLKRLSDFRERDGQANLSKIIEDCLASSVPLAAEAPTGTGKTIAYLVGGVSAVKRLESAVAGEEMPIVVATATVGLQTQILASDLPKLMEAGVIAQGSAVIAKGRGRYFCILSAERLLAGEVENMQYDIFDPESNVKVDGIDEIREMSSAWHTAAWKGDIDTYGHKRPVFWATVQASSDTCIGPRCDFYEDCPYFEDRRRLAKAKVVIANHDLVLADLSAQMSDQETVFPFNRYILLVDEAHHLPSKAMEAGAANDNLCETLEKLPAVAAAAKKFFVNGEFAKFLDSKGITTYDFDISRTQTLLRNAIDLIRQISVDPDSRTKRFTKGQVPESLRLPLAELLSELGSLKDNVAKAASSLKSSNLANRDARFKPMVAEALYEASMVNGILSSAWQALRLFTEQSEIVRWVHHTETDAWLFASPVEGDKILTELMWKNPRVRVALLSATLKDLEGFERFRMRSGLPQEARTFAMPHSFPYQENLLVVYDTMKNTPARGTRDEYIKELQTAMPSEINPGEGTLIVFTSKQLMNAVVPALRKKFGDRVLCQGEMGIKQLLVEHKGRIDAGGGSILAGLATVAEGLDLPGAYCTHVMITGIPFAVPTNPVEEERAEQLGNDYFNKHSLPDAFVKLTQMVGRLMRRETDRGRITIFDKRLVETKYGWKLMRALPDFRKKRKSTLVAAQCIPQ
ncbi:hypothetical protein F6X40_10575 [Paraburkholderia sp. UCT31]|uniref:helicase C-terminal domain-containing protein n=1 Tax=Paraburkholderia sp. UCT31 TaxID=2615209 RepID=UPI001655A80D|nr:helicase C-terminal domain-containing protein [Paraburkholderia sp. UCT31]MBC8737252.1 hypothetical protein [Paraburkholderia sp. UCT31]